jgi:hypothetical protein
MAPAGANTSLILSLKVMNNYRASAGKPALRSLNKKPDIRQAYLYPGRELNLPSHKLRQAGLRWKKIL